MKVSSASTARQMVFLFGARIVLNTAYRIVYPFLPAIARGLDISIASASRLVSLRLLPGLAAPWLGSVGDRKGRRRMIEVALVLFALAGLLVASAGATWAFGAALVLYGFSKVVFDPSIHALLGDIIPYDRRARAIGIVELSWSAAWLFGVPLSGYLIQHFGWKAPWAMLGLLGLAFLLLVRRSLPSDRQPGDARDPAAHAPPAQPWLAILRRPGIVALLAAALLLAFAIELPFIVYGAWLEQSFGLGLTSLGLASAVVGIAEAVAEIGTTLLTDRLGKRRSVLAGLLGLAAGLGLLPRLASHGLVAALGGMVLVVLAFEFAIVSFIPLASEAAPDARALLLSCVVSAMLLGRMAGSFAGGWLWERQVGAISLQAHAGAAAALAAFAVMFLGVREIADPPTP
ncbi:MAG TPA: MFS transporter [Anaerolineae bacterium]|nr:MFS transporter [Anaerolineae bacterium]